MIARLTALYLAIFAIVLAALSVAAYAFVGGQYHSLLLPALNTPEGRIAFDTAMRHVAFTIAAFDVPLLVLVGVASAFLARLSLAPLLEARARERTFLADAAHELRSPLATIASVAQASASQNADARAREAFGLISSTAIDASQLIGDLLTLARTPQAKLLACEPVDLAAVVHGCVREFEPRAQAASIAIDADVQSAIVNGDGRRLRELVRNLLENALRHARTRITVQCTSEDGRAVLRVADDGSGVAPADRERIFERFVRGRDHAAGTGLGLAIARWVAHAHDGLLVLDDDVPGASFTARLPLLR